MKRGDRKQKGSWDRKSSLQREEGALREEAATQWTDWGHTMLPLASLAAAVIVFLSLFQVSGREIESYPVKGLCFLGSEV